MGGDKSKRNEATRQERKAKKRKLEDAIPDVPGDNDVEVPETNTATTEQAPKKRKRGSDDAGEVVKEKKSKKEKRKSNGEQQVGDAADKGDEKIAAPSTDAKVPEKENGDAPKKSKKERKAERRARDLAEAAAAAAAKKAEGEETGAVTANTTTTPASSGASAAAPKHATSVAVKEKKINKERKKKPNGNGEKSEKAARFIVFIGSLPYTANQASIQKHFASVKPTSVRSPMQPSAPTKSKGYAFLEFGSYDHMKTCLKLFHHSTFDDGVSPPRKISVELTAGGGGNTKGRKDKIKAKNEKLNEERQRRIHEEAKAKAEKRDGAAGADANDSIHPSRRARVPGAAM